MTPKHSVAVSSRTSPYATRWACSPEVPMLVYAGFALPWAAVGADLEPSVRASIMRDSHVAGPAWLGPKIGTMRPSEMMELLTAAPDGDLEARAAAGIWTGPLETKVNTSAPPPFPFPPFSVPLHQQCALLLRCAWPSCAPLVAASGATPRWHSPPGQRASLLST